MKIVLICKEFNLKSTSRTLINLALKLSETNQLYFLYHSPLKNREKIEKKYITKSITYINVDNFINNSSYQNSIKLINSLHKNLLLIKFLKKINPDIISFHSVLSDFICCKLTGIKLIKTYYGTQFDAYLDKIDKITNPSLIDTIINKLINVAIYLIELFQIILANKVIAISKFTQQEIYYLYKKKVEFIYLGVSSDFIKNTVTKKSSKPELFINVLSISRITPYKGYTILLNIVNQIRKLSNISVKLTIAGVIQHRKHYDKLQNMLTQDDRIVFSASLRLLHRLYKYCDIYATCDKYPFLGLPILEAMAYQKPVIALNYGAVPEIIINGQTGYFTNNEDEFKNYLLALIKNKRMRIKMGKQGYLSIVKNFNDIHTVQEYCRIFKYILHN